MKSRDEKFGNSSLRAGGFQRFIEFSRGSLGSLYPILTKWVGPTTNTFDVKNCIASKALQTRSTLNAPWDLPSDLLLLAIFDERF